MPPTEPDDCPRCGRVFGVADESCRHCGFDPVNDELDALEYELHQEKKKEKK